METDTGGKQCGLLALWENPSLGEGTLLLSKLSQLSILQDEEKERLMLIPPRYLCMHSWCFVEE